MINALLTDLREKNLLNKKLNERLQLYSGKIKLLFTLHSMSGLLLTIYGYLLICAG